MDDPEYTTRPPHFLRKRTHKGGGLFSTLSTIWRNTMDALQSTTHDLAKDPKSSPSIERQSLPLPSYVLFADENVVCIHKNKMKFRIEPFCNHNHIQSTDLYIPVVKQDYIGLKRDALEDLLSQAVLIFAKQKGNYSQMAFAHALLNDFDFLNSHKSPSVTKPASVHTISNLECPYIIPSPWERNLT